MNEGSWSGKTEQIGIEQFGPKHIASASAACAHLFEQFGRAMHLVYRTWNDAEPEWSLQEIAEVVGRWKENYAIANARWGEAEDYLSGLQALVEQMRTWKPSGMKDSVKVGAMTREQMGLVRFIKENAGSHSPAVEPIHLGRLEWGGSTISFVEIFDVLAGKGYLEIPEGVMVEFVRRLQQSIIVRKRMNGPELDPDSLVNRFKGRRSIVLRKKLEALPEAKKRKSKGKGKIQR